MNESFDEHWKIVYDANSCLQMMTKYMNLAVFNVNQTMLLDHIAVRVAFMNLSVR